jgi:hypothetical protein
VWLGLRITERNAARSIDASERVTDKSLWQKANETEIRDIQAKLDGFYGPLVQLLQTDHLMAQELRNRQPDKQTHRLLVKLFNKEWLAALPVGDKRIVAEICNRAAELETFIREKSGMVDLQLIPYLARASAHFRVLHLAHKGELGADPTTFARYVFPKQLDDVLALEVNRLSRRCDRLRAAPGAPLGAIEPLNIPKELELDPWPNPKRM